MSCFLPLLAAICHELGHLSAMLLLGVPFKSIRITPAGFDIVYGPSLSYRRESLCLIAGIAVNALLFCLALPFAEQDSWRLFADSNLALALLNALPIPSLDGGRLLENRLLQKHPPFAVKTICSRIGYLCLFFLWIAGIYLLLHTADNLSLFLLCLYLFVKEAK